MARSLRYAETAAALKFTSMRRLNTHIWLHSQEHRVMVSSLPRSGGKKRKKKRPRGRSPTIAARVAPLSDFFLYIFFFTTCLGHRLENLPKKPFVFNTRPRAAISRELLLECRMQVFFPAEAGKEALGQKVVSCAFAKRRARSRPAAGRSSGRLKLHLLATRCSLLAKSWRRLR